MSKQTSDRIPICEIKKLENSELMKMIADNENPNSSNASAELFIRLIRQVQELKKEVLLLSGQNSRKPRKRRIYYYEDVELTDELLVEYIDTEAFTIYKLEKIVGAKKNVLRNRYKQAKKKIQALKCQNTDWQGSAF